MRAFTDFRVFYNQSIFPELMFLEKKRRAIVRRILLAIVLCSLLFFAVLYIDIASVTMMAMIPVVIWGVNLAKEVRNFYAEFKPRIVGAILDFLDNDVNYRHFKYEASGLIPKEKFLASRLFVTGADEYSGEDYISGTVREMPVEMCELKVREFSAVRSRLNYVFKGVFLVGDYLRPNMHGSIIMIPDTYRKYLSLSARHINLSGGKRVTENLLPEFEAIFDTYCTPDARIKTVLSEDMQRVLIHFRQQTGREIYVSIIESKIYIAVTHAYDLLEPWLWRSNTSFELVAEFYEDLNLLLELALDVDVMN